MRYTPPLRMLLANKLRTLPRLTLLKLPSASKIKTIVAMQSQPHYATAKCGSECLHHGNNSNAVNENLLTLRPIPLQASPVNSRFLRTDVKSNSSVHKILAQFKVKNRINTLQHARKRGDIHFAFSHMLPYLWPKEKLHKYRIVGALAALLLAKIATVQTPLLLGRLVDTLAVLQPLVEPSGTMMSMSKLANSAIPLAITSGYVLSRVMTSGLTELRNALFTRVSSAASTIIASNIFYRVHQLDLDFLLQIKSGELTTILSRGVRSVTNLMQVLLFQVIPTFFELSLVLAILSYRLGPVVAGITSVSMLAYMVFTIRVTRRRTELRKEMNFAEQKAGGIMQDSLMNAEVIRYFNAQNFESLRYTDYQRQVEDANVKVANSLAYLNFGQQVIFNAGLWSAMCYTALQATSGIVPIGHLAFVSSLLYQLAIPLNMIGTAYREIRLNLVDLQKMNDLISLQPPHVELNNASAFQPQTDKGLAVTFDNVSFSYLGQEELLQKLQAAHLKNSLQIENDSYSWKPRRTNVLSNLNLNIEPGSKVGIVGVSGSGKTTISKLLYRFYDPQEGKITIDGQDLKTVNAPSVRQYIGIVPQDVVLFNESILYNIRYGSPDATFEDVEKAVKAADLYGIIRSMPQGYNTFVGERGLKLSGGEKQRLGIVRCLLKNPKLLILDEATSSLDLWTEQKILKTIDAVRTGKTVVIIAHRLACVLNCEKIVVLRDGEVVEEGTHKELLQIPDGLYRSLWFQQINE